VGLRPDPKLAAVKIHVDEAVAGEQAVFTADRGLEIHPRFHGEGAIERHDGAGGRVVSREPQHRRGSGSEVTPELLERRIAAQHRAHVGHDGKRQARGVDVVGRHRRHECGRPFLVPRERGGCRLPFGERKVVPRGHERRARRAVAGFRPRCQGLGPQRRDVRRSREDGLAGGCGEGAELTQATQRRLPDVDGGAAVAHEGRHGGLDTLRFERPEELERERPVGG
jgi:hypothetical protein